MTTCASAGHHPAWEGPGEDLPHRRPPRSALRRSRWGRKGAETRKSLWLRTRPPVSCPCADTSLSAARRAAALGSLPRPPPPPPRATPLTAAVKPLQFALVTFRPAGSPWVWAPAGLPRGSGWHLPVFAADAQLRTQRTGRGLWALLSMLSCTTWPPLGPAPICEMKGSLLEAGPCGDIAGWAGPGRVGGRYRGPSSARSQLPSRTERTRAAVQASGPRTAGPAGAGVRPAPRESET